MYFPYYLYLFSTKKFPARVFWQSPNLPSSSPRPQPEAPYSYLPLPLYHKKEEIVKEEGGERVFGGLKLREEDNVAAGWVCGKG